MEDGETEVEALIRECEEELGVRVAVGGRIGEDVLLGNGAAVLKVYLAHLADDRVPQPYEHAELRWLTADELDSVSWLPADAPIVAALRPRPRGALTAFRSVEAAMGSPTWPSSPTGRWTRSPAGSGSGSGSR